MTPGYHQSYGPRFREVCSHATSSFASRDDGEAARKLVAEAKQMLDEGLDPNMIDDQGRSLIGNLASDIRGSNQPGLEIARALLEAGANPMLHDMPLGRQISHNQSSLLVTQTLSQIARMEEAGKGLRDAQGGNVLHYLAEHHQWLAAVQLDEDIYALAEGESGDLFFPQAMIQARNNEGDTPLDALWRGEPLAWNPDTLDNAWYMTRTLLLRGADPLLPDADGRNVAERIEALIQAGLERSHDDAWTRIEAALNQARFEQTSAPAAGGGRGMRL